MLVIAPMPLQPHFAAMFRDFGEPARIPFLTRFALSGWFGPALALPTMVALARLFLTRRRIWGQVAIVAAGFTLIAGVALLQLAMYLPIFRLAGQVNGE